MSDAQGLRVILVAAALIALLHGLLLKQLQPDLRGPYVDRPGRPHDGQAHPGLGEMFRRSRENDLREMFEFASQQSMPAFRQDRAPVDWNRCDDITDYGLGAPKDPALCTTGAEGASYVGAAILNNYVDENPMNGGLIDGVGAYDETTGFGGSML